MLIYKAHTALLKYGGTLSGVTLGGAIFAGLGVAITEVGALDVGSGASELGTWVSTWPWAPL